jgi:AraC-like DNA-binding protein
MPPSDSPQQNAPKTAFYSAQAHTCKILCDYLIRKGYEASKLSDVLDLKLDDLDTEEARVNLDRYYALWREAVEYTDKPDLALRLAARNVMEGMGLVGHVFFNCKTLKQALEHYQRYYQLVNQSIEINILERGDEAVIQYSVKGGFEYCRYEMEYSLTIAAHRAKRLLQSGLDMRYVAFAHAEPDYPEEYEKMFRCPIKFGQSHSEIAFDAHYLAYKMPRNSPSLYKVLTAHLDRLLSSLGKGASVASKVEAIVSKKISDAELDADYVASRLNMSRNTLYRKLKKEGVAYQDIVDGVRADYAIQHLKSGEYSITELTFILGFSEVSAFSRAFKRWTGQTPNSYVKGDASQG